MASAATPTQEITVDGDHWNIKTITTFKTTELDFKIGESFVETTGDGRKVDVSNYYVCIFFKHLTFYLIFKK